ncbi:hypothetical protein, partial [Klebsiella pneumoniae]|uniref:hypothetical protein n=1 Tax=Klebsiella pneumoniae TaxID=573 RepID=UPI00195306A3
PTACFGDYKHKTTAFRGVQSALNGVKWDESSRTASSAIDRIRPNHDDGLTCTSTPKPVIAP